MKSVFLLAALFCFTYLPAFAQDNDNPEPFSTHAPSTFSKYCWPCKKRHYGGCKPTPPPPSTPVPIDGGLTVLLAAGAAYGIKKYKRR